MREAIIIGYYRGKVMLDIDPSLGGMVAVGLEAKQIKPCLKPGVLVGCENSPKSVTLTGDKKILEAVTEEIKEAYPNAFVRALEVDRAYHSRETAPPFHL